MPVKMGRPRLTISEEEFAARVQQQKKGWEQSRKKIMVSKETHQQLTELTKLFGFTSISATIDYVLNLALSVVSRAAKK